MSNVVQEEQTATVNSAVTEEAEQRKEWRLRINYRALVQNMPYILFLSALALVYIANSHMAEKRVRRINRLDREIKELKWEYLNAKSELMFRSKMSEVSKAVEPLGLKTLNSPPQKIEISPDKEKE